MAGCGCATSWPCPCRCVVACYKLAVCVTFPNGRSPHERKLPHVFVALHCTYLARTLFRFSCRIPPPVIASRVQTSGSDLSLPPLRHKQECSGNLKLASATDSRAPQEPTARHSTVVKPATCAMTPSATRHLPSPFPTPLCYVHALTSASRSTGSWWNPPRRTARYT